VLVNFLFDYFLLTLLFRSCNLIYVCGQYRIYHRLNHNYKYKLIPFIDVKGYIWEKQIINRVFVKQENDENDFKSFVLKVSASDAQRYEAMCSTLGYLIHAHKDKTDQKAIIFNDEEISDHPNGGSGKSVTFAKYGFVIIVFYLWCILKYKAL